MYETEELSLNEVLVVARSGLGRCGPRGYATAREKGPFKFSDGNRPHMATRSVGTSLVTRGCLAAENPFKFAVKFKRALHIK